MPWSPGAHDHVRGCPVITRELRRRALHDMRDAGCTCAPELQEIAAENMPTGAKHALWVRHDLTCALADWSNAAYKAGRIPTILRALGRCDR